jgi:hypothetical protein
MTRSLEIHPLAAAFPLLPRDELAALADDIKANGLRHAIITLDGKILDGRNRLEACLIAGVEPRFARYDGGLDDAMRVVVAENIRRRHLAPGQADAIIVDIDGIVALAAKAAAERSVEGRRKGAHKAKKSSSKSASHKPNRSWTADRRSSFARTAAADIAEATGRSTRGIERALHVKQADPVLHAQVKP